ncbi:MAG: hypothetical protein JWR77_1403, partial [Rhizorhabdus sp.]|nr:hypothetical protein [Rhizorhabdus sp.]
MSLGPLLPEESSVATAVANQFNDYVIADLS